MEPFKILSMVESFKNPKNAQIPTEFDDALRRFEQESKISARKKRAEKMNSFVKRIIGLKQLGR